MHLKIKMAAIIIICAILLCLGMGYVKYQGTDKKKDRVWHHKIAEGADVSLGLSEIPENYLVDENFVSHLPLIVIDTGGEEIVNYKHYSQEKKSFVYQEGVDPDLDMQIALIDNPDMINHLGDTPSVLSSGTIRIRGNTSSTDLFPKKQYLIKLTKNEGEKNRVAVFGMTPASTWILNGTQLDRSYLRNYIAMNTGGELNPFTPDMRYCEAFMKKGDAYEYMGLYIMYEKVEQGRGRVDIPDVSTPQTIGDSSYLLLRDRIDQSAYNLSVWSTKHQRGDNWINLAYPSPKNITKEYWEYIKNDIEEIEDILYSDDYYKFVQYRKRLDVNSFVDYYIINEFFANYDSGWNSTYIYKNEDGRIAIGPFWDFDGSADNYSKELLELDVLAFGTSPWFNRLISDEYFANLVNKRYAFLRKKLLSSTYLEKEIDEAAKYIAKPVQRDISRWGSLYEGRMEVLPEKDSDIEIDRNRKEWSDEVQRVKNILRIHGRFMDNGNAVSPEGVIFDESRIPNAFGTLLLVITVIVSIVLMQRKGRG